MGVIYEYFMFDGKSSLEFGVHISGSGTFDAPERDFETVEIPGRNGELTVDNGRFKNVSVTYPAFIVERFRHNFDAFKAFMLSRSGYRRLADSYSPEYYRLARYVSELKPDMATLNRAGKFNVTFDCDPRRFLKTGEKKKTFEEAGTIVNRTLFAAKPLLRVYGTGTLNVGDAAVTVLGADGYTDIDCDLQEAYKGETNCNENIKLVDGIFPELKPGKTDISFTGLEKVEITPRWWTL